MDRWTMDSIKSCNAARGHHWFDRSTLRFFRSRVSRTVYQGPGGVYFVSSEQKSPAAWGMGWGSRKFTVRKFNPKDCSVSTVQDFQKFFDGREAAAAAKRLARGGR